MLYASGFVDDVMPGGGTGAKSALSDCIL